MVHFQAKSGENICDLKSFRINGLFETSDIYIPMNKEALILIAENGSGKTTILNTLYYSLKYNFAKLNDLHFKNIILEFTSGATIEIKKSDISACYDSSTYEEFASYLRLSCSGHDTERLLRDIKRGLNPMMIRRRISSLRERYGFNLSNEIVDRYLESISLKNKRNENTKEKEKLDNAKNIIQENLSQSILYFPTYRRIEEDLQNLGYEKSLENESSSGAYSLNEEHGNLIQFGMNDVIEKFKEIKEEIKDSAFDLFSKVTGEMLSQFVDGIDINQEMKDSIQPDTLKIVLARVGEKNISAEYRNKIENLVVSRDINLPKYGQLVYFLSKLVVLYEQQREKDESIKKFANICNQYLNGKQIIYDEASADISIIKNNSNKELINIRNLSSGEKQIISIFSRIYLDSTDDFILLFDEPELSLSIEWQRLLLPHILESGKCKLLIATTHSPFVFENSLDEYAEDISSFLSNM